MFEGRGLSRQEAANLTEGVKVRSSCSHRSHCLASIAEVSIDEAHNQF